jgi:hypothetical protein
MTLQRQHMAMIATVVAGLALAGIRSEAHKPITSPYTYNEDVFPIVRERCGRCHVAGGVAPMSLMTYKDAFPWGESIRTELVAGHMPPWTVDTASNKLKNAQGLTARELNVLLTWATGGNPIGNPEHPPTPVELKKTWPLGTPDLTLQLPSSFTLTAEVQSDTRQFIVPTGTREDRWIRAADLLPETPAIVRSASMTVKPGPPAPGENSPTDAPERILSLWLPGEDPVPLGNGAAFRLPAGADLVVRVHYKKTWEYERKTMSDRSTIGLYFAPPPAADVRAIVLSPAGAGGRSDQRLEFGRVLDEDLTALAVYADPGLTYSRAQIHAVRPDGSRVELIRFQPQPDWTRRYWFEQPVVLPRGSRLEVVLAIDEKDALLPPGATPIAPRPPDPASARITVDGIGRVR